MKKVSKKNQHNYSYQKYAPLLQEMANNGLSDMAMTLKRAEVDTLSSALAR
ncbi:TPA: hypothetical protein ACX6QL_002039 [Photobacterium damselae]